MAGNAQGLDGWATTDLALLPLGACQLLRNLVLQWGRRQEWPFVWGDVRQVHLRKDVGQPMQPCRPTDF